MDRLRFAIVACWLIGVLNGLTSATALVATPVVAGPEASLTGYATPRAVQLTGAQVTLVNADPVAPHDVRSRMLGPDRKPLFKSELAQAGEAVPVVGTENLSPGDYEFYCTLHGLMVGTLTVIESPA